LLIVTSVNNDDNSIIALLENTMHTLQLFRGDTVLIKEKKRKVTFLIVLAYNGLNNRSVRIGRIIRYNFRT
jgi:transitional endoplasmic reticulum ATPase